MESIYSKSILTNNNNNKNHIVNVQHIITVTTTRIFQVLLEYFLGHYSAVFVSLAGFSGNFEGRGLTLHCLQSRKAWDALYALM